MRHFHVVVLRWRQRNVQRKRDARAKLLFYLSKLNCFLPFSLNWPSSLRKLPIVAVRGGRYKSFNRSLWIIHAAMGINDIDHVCQGGNKSFLHPVDIITSQKCPADEFLLKRTTKQKVPSNFCSLSLRENWKKWVSSNYFSFFPAYCNPICNVYSSTATSKWLKTYVICCELLRARTLLFR